MLILLWVPTRVFVSTGVDPLSFLEMVRDVIVSKRTRSSHLSWVYDKMQRSGVNFIDWVKRMN
jgi:hypothetical protein